MGLIMKQFTLFSILLFSFCLMAKAESDSLLIKLKDGNSEKIAISQIQKIVFENITRVDDQALPNGSLEVTGNYPNPFADQTIIEFEIANPGDVTIIIFDNNGNQVQKLECLNCHPGKNILQWNCLDSKNDQVLSGTYYYEVRYNNEIQSKKMIIIK